MKKTILVAIVFCVVSVLAVFGGGNSESAIYVNEEFGFSFEYPADYKVEPVLLPQEVTRIANQNEYKIPVLTASVRDRSEDVKLTDLPERVVKFMEAGIQGSSQFNMLEQKIVKLSDGSDAIIFQFTWVLSDGNTVMETVTIIAFKGNKQITITGNTINGLGYSLEDLSRYCMTMRLAG
jgi:hypothetical protein